MAGWRTMACEKDITMEAVDYADSISARLERAQMLAETLFERLEMDAGRREDSIDAVSQLGIMAGELREALSLTDALSRQLLGREAA